MQRYHVPYMVASAAFGVLAARGVFHLYGTLLRRFLTIRTPYSRAARFGCFPAMAAFVVVMYGAQVAAPWVGILAASSGRWVYAVVLGAVGIFPAFFIFTWWLSRRVDTTALQKGSLPGDALRMETRRGQAIAVGPPEDIEKIPAGAVLFVELAVFHELYLLRPPRPAAVYGFAHEEPFLERPLRGAWVLDDALHISGAHGQASEGKLPPLLVVAATLREGVEHEFARRISLCRPGSVLRPGAVRIFGLDKRGTLVLDVGAKRERVRPGDTPSEPIKWNGFLRAGNILARERAEVSVVSFRLFPPDRLDVMRPGTGAEDLGAAARPIVSGSPPPTARGVGRGYFEQIQITS